MDKIIIPTIRSKLVDPSPGVLIKHNTPTWLRKPLQWLIERYLESEQNYAETYTITKLAVNDLLDAVYKTEYAIAKVYNDKCRVVIVGSDVYDKILQLPYPHPLSIDDHILNGHKGPKTISGLQIVCIPYFEGILMLPNTVIQQLVVT